MIELLKELWRGGNYGFVQREKEDKRLSFWIDLKQDAIKEIWRDPTANFFFGVHPSASIPTHSEGETPVPQDARFLGARNGLVQCANCLFADIDNPELPNFAFTPSVIVSSGNGNHVYWLLSETLQIQDDEDRQVVKTLQRNWAAFVGGDLAATDLRRTLRPAGSFNQKYRPARPVEFVECDLSRRYDVSDLYNASYRTPKVFVYSGKVSGDIDKHITEYLRKSRRDVNNYADWIAVGSYIKLHYPGADGLEAWKSVSMQSPKYRDGDCEKRWEGLGHV